MQILLIAAFIAAVAFGQNWLINHAQVAAQVVDTWRLMDARER